MRIQHRRSIAIAATLALFGLPAAAQSIDPAGVSAVLGRPLDISIRVRPGTPGVPFGPECVRAAVSYGENRLPPEQLRVRLASTTQPDTYRVRILSIAPVLEPLVNIRLTLTCGGERVREFAIFADPPLNLPQTAADKIAEPAPTVKAAPASQVEEEARRAEARRAARVARAKARARAAARAKAARERAEAQAALELAAQSQQIPPAASVAAGAAPVGPAAGSSPATTAPAVAAPASAAVDATSPPASAAPATSGTAAARPTEGVRLKLEPAELEALATTLLQLSRQQGNGTATTAAADPASPPPPGEAAPAVAGNLKLTRELAQLREENRKALAAIASMQSRLEEAEKNRSEAWRQWWPIGLAFLMLPLMVWALRRGSNSALPLGASRPSNSMVDEPALPTVLAAGDGDLSVTASAERNDASEPAFGMVDTTQPAAWARANVGTPSLAVEELEELNHEAHEMISRGYFGAAAALIEEHLQSREAKNPWLLMRLLDLYREMGQPWNYQRVASQLQTLFNVRVPGLDEQDRPGRPLERFPTTLETLKLEWSNPGAVETLRLLLLRPTYIEELDLGAFRELLLLYAIAHEKSMTADGQAASSPVPSTLYSEALSEARRMALPPSGDGTSGAAGKA